MKYYINGRFLTQKMTGINRFAFEITRHLSRLEELTIIVPKGKLNRSYDLSGLNIKEYGHLQSHLWEQINLPAFFINKKDYLLLNFSGLGPLFIRNKIVTIHDVSYLYNPTWFSKSYYFLYRTLTPLIIKTSRRLLTVSNFSKEEIKKYYKVPPTKIDVVYNAVSGFKRVCNQDSKQKYVLSVGSIDPRKNFKILLAAFKDQRLADVNLHIVGDINKIFNESIEDTDLPSNIKFLGRIPDEELIRQYSNASLFILPSLYEGFGIPPLEALMCGCPIAISDIPVFHEIFEEAASYFNPSNVEDVINTILDNKDSQIFNIENIHKILTKFSWENSAIKVLESILKITN